MKRIIILITIFSSSYSTYIGTPIFGDRILLVEKISVNQANIEYLNEYNKCPGCCLNGSSLIDAQLDYVNLKEARLISTEFIFAEINGGCFEKTDIRSAKFNHAYSKNSNFTQVNAFDTDFSEGIFDNSKFNKSNLAQARFNQSKCKNCCFTNTKMVQSILKNGQFQGSSFSYSDLHGSDATNAKFDGADLDHITADYTNFDDASFNLAQMNNSDFNHSNFKNAQLRDANLENSNIEHADFESANLINANLNNAKINAKTNFTNANLSGAYGDLANINKAIICNTIMPDGNIAFDNCPAELKIKLEIQEREEKETIEKGKFKKEISERENQQKQKTIIRDKIKQDPELLS